MLPAFPNFKKLELSDKQDIEFFTHALPPYSDFNFTSLWAWDTGGRRKVAELNGNLVVYFTDYETEEPFLSFIGTNLVPDTARTILSKASDLGVQASLRLLPEEAATNLDPIEFTIEEDQDNADYVYAVEQLSSLEGGSFKSKRQSADRFLRAHPEVRFEVGDILNEDLQAYIVLVLRGWEERKKSGNSEYELTHEETTIRRILKTAQSHNLIVGSVFLGSVMAAFSIDEILPNQYCTEHFSKAQDGSAGVYDYLNLKMAQHLKARDVVLWNWEQDLGIDGLRRSKASYRPLKFLKKYKVSLAAM